MKTILYARVSTVDQTLDHQRTQAAAAGFKIDTVVADHGVSGVSTKLAERREGRRLFDMLRSGGSNGRLRIAHRGVSVPHQHEPVHRFFG